MNSFYAENKGIVHINQGFIEKNELIQFAWVHDYNIYEYLLKLRGAMYKGYSPSLFSMLQVRLEIVSES